MYLYFKYYRLGKINRIYGRKYVCYNVEESTFEIYILFDTGKVIREVWVSDSSLSWNKILTWKGLKEDDLDFKYSGKYFVRDDKIIMIMYRYIDKSSSKLKRIKHIGTFNDEELVAYSSSFFKLKHFDTYQKIG